MNTLNSNQKPKPVSGFKCALLIALMFSLPCAFTLHAQEMVAFDDENEMREVINTATTTAPAAALPADNNSPGGPFEKNMYTGIYFNPLGFVAIGPMLGAEFTFDRRFILDAHIRIPKFGIQTGTFAEGCGGETDFKGIGVGASVKYFFQIGNGGIYAGPTIEYSALKYKCDNHGKLSSDPYLNAETNVLIAAANIGYKFMFSSGFYLRAGGYFGTYKELTNIRDGEKYSPSTDPFYFFELGFGFAF